MGPPRVLPPPVRCSICNTNFRRQEHLTRHMRTHTREKPYQCSLCEKRFSRLDVLNRHTASHKDQDKAPAATVSARACGQCALDRVRCSRSQPCRRCADRKLACRYPMARKNRVRAHNSSNDEQQQGPSDPTNFGGERSMSPIDPPMIRQALDQADVHELAAAFVSEPEGTSSRSRTNMLHVVGDTTAAAAAALSCTIGNPASDPSAWMHRIDTMELGASTQNLYDFGQPGLGVSFVNWISPQDHQALDWDAQMASFAINQANVNAENAGFSFLFQLEAQPMNNEQQEMWNDRGDSPAEQGANITSNHHRVNGAPQERQQHHQQTEALLGPGGDVIESEEESEFVFCRSVVNSVTSINSTEGRYYVDGTGARAPFGGRSRNRCSVGNIETLNGGDAALATSSYPALSPATDLCSAAAYDNLVQEIRAECHIQCIDIDLAVFPSFPQIQLYVRHYFDNFHPVFPFLRKSSFAEDSSQEGVLLLAVSVIGSRYMRRLQGRQPSELLSHLLNSTLRRRRYGYGLSDDEGDDDTPFVPGQVTIEQISPSLQMLQSGILNVICMLHSGKKALVARAFMERHYLVEACHSLELICNSSIDYDLKDLMNLNGQEFRRRWLKRESEIRTGMMIWLLDSMFLYEFDAKPLMQIDDVKATLPSHEAVWEDPHLAQLGNRSFSQVTFPSSIEMLYIEKRLPPHLGEFSIGILINAIYRNTLQVLTKEQIPLNSWTPTATVQQRFQKSPIKESWLPATPTTSKWRNSACDCLDVLHWPANSKIAQRSGSEHHTILCLHLSRLIILTPTVYIQTFATASAEPHQPLGNTQSSKRYATARNQVLQWVVQDQFKARLSIIHCGALYWHVRRYSCDSVMEPYAIYIATLVLWAFCVSMQFVGQGTANDVPVSCESSAVAPEMAEATAGREEEPEPSFIHLDRPLDDELVQLFVRLGYKMSAYISKVGNIQDRDAPTRILQEGIRLLDRGTPATPPREDERQLHSLQGPCYTWGVEESFIESLRRLLRSKANDARAGGP